MSSDELKANGEEKNPFLIGKPFAANDLAESADASAAADGSEAPSGGNGKRYSVLPHRTNLTSRLWLDRFDRNNSEYKKLVDSTGAHPDTAAGARRPRHLVLKHMKDSYIEGELPFKSNPHVREEYVNFYGSIRIAKLLEDLDAMAGSISYTHCDDNTPETPPLTIVTASVDRIDLLKRPSLEQDTKVSGMVTYVGHSSMEITITVEEVNDADEPTDAILKARFTMVARDPITNQSVQVNPLVLENDAERRLFAMGAELKAQKKLAASQALTKAPPTPEERLVIHDLWLQSKKYAEAPTLPASLAWMSDSKMQSVVITQPQDRNIHNFIFGGYLMRQAFEVAYTTASVFCKGHPVFLAMDDIWFRKPVPIGSILRFDSRVVYSRAPTNTSFQVMVTAEVIDIKTGTRDTTNVFHYTFGLDKAKNSHQLPQVLPRTYEESMNYLEGKRKWELGLEMAKENHSKLLNLW
ncbi:HotDog domain-containing protein [Catenaria anguillulae PL171]|uniref:HotDog domain-containing protein n=1 Tax=Catenaria anguillulae PL171 TaxID=765915 RepID=A0A1Y2HSL5_9FUNG|nr:HotDog domain-containing protein [Catenaria anguillulae PL171]